MYLVFGFRARLVRISSQRGVGEYISCPEIRTDHTFHSLKVRYCEDLGVTANQASTLYTFFGVASALVRVLAGRFFDISRTNPLYALQLAMAVSGISTLLMPLAPSYGWLVLYSIMYGLADGGMGCATFVIPAKLLSEEERAMGMAIFQTVTYTSCAGGSPLAGKVRARYPGSTSVNNRPRGWGGWGASREWHRGEGRQTFFKWFVWGFYQRRRFPPDLKHIQGTVHLVNPFTPKFKKCILPTFLKKIV